MQNIKIWKGVLADIFGRSLAKLKKGVVSFYRAKKGKGNWHLQLYSRVLLRETDFGFHVRSFGCVQNQVLKVHLVHKKGTIQNGADKHKSLKHSGVFR